MRIDPGDQDDRSARPGSETISPDRPRTDPTHDDQLDRGPFAKALAKAIGEMSPTEGFVIALHGPWGSGKTTILNYVKYYLNNQADALRPTIVDFAPWWFSGHQDLTERFFDQLLAQLKANSSLEKKTLSLMSEFAEAVSDLPIPILGSIAKAGSGVLKAFENARRKDLGALKVNLHVALREAGKFLIVIDDLDRLTADEIRQMFRLVKAVADFPNTIYLMAFDKEVAMAAVENLQGVQRGQDYLEKIVQVAWEIPPPDDFLLAQIFLSDLERPFKGTPTELFDENDWNNMFALLRHFLKTPRDVTRLSNALLTTYAAVKGEVNFTDFVAVEAIRVFVPSIYELVRSEPNYFVGIHDMFHIDRGVFNSFHKSWFENPKILPSKHKQPVKDVISRLFPNVETAWGGIAYGASVLDNWKKECRAASPDITPIYFRLALPPTSISRERVLGILKLSNDRHAIATALDALLREKLPDGRTMLAPFLERACDLAEFVDQNAVHSVIWAILNDDFFILTDTSRSFGFPIDNSLRIYWLTKALLLRLPKDQRCGFLKSAIFDAKGVAAVADLVGDLEPRAKANQEDLLSEAHWQELKEIALERIRQAAKDSTLSTLPRLARVLWLWKSWGRDGEAKEWVEGFAADNDGLLKILEISVNEAQESSASNPVPRPVLNLVPTGLSEFLNLQKVRNRLKSLKSETKLSEKQRFAIEELLKDS